MHFLDLTLPTLAENLALDEALLLSAEEDGGECLRLWESPTHAVVLGAGSKLGEEVSEAACVKDGVPILRRSSGGGTVLLGKGCLLFSLVLDYGRDPALKDVRASYRWILSRIGPIVSSYLAENSVVHAGISDLALGDCKISGNAQHRKRNHLLHHGTILYDFDLDAISRYLKTPQCQPEYRRRRGHGAFVTNLGLSREQLREGLKLAWRASSRLENWPEERTRTLVAEKYGQSEWHRRR